ncbi:ParA family protein [Rehaibacterium terrae]|jgi:chromosome partitioning protein|uniref:Chromosome partitioning protein n=1 Tax=Rehaibacterium terrae TaxID=1341696 RepID=A0A7W7XZT4_9GAMM|nr:ParA family protein [Rehaibacterium terrae]MBB5015491.1 chromosome partitioning protein [Rehaibacterium terrae]
MRRILVASSKGGCGKTTIATHLAAHFAVEGKRTVLVDADRQGSAMHWCERRAGLDSAVLPVDGTRRHWDRALPGDAEVAVIDGPAGAMAKDLEHFLDVADAVLVPVLPSALDIEATVPFLDSLAEHPRVRKGRLPVALVGNRLKPWTHASQQALAQLRTWPYPLAAELRDSQAYVLLVGLGKSLFDYHSEQVRNHQADWAPLFRWLKRHG